MDAPHITLEQWRALIAVVEAGGYAQAAQRLNKSQSAVTYAVQKIEEMLGVAVFEIQGRKAQLTGTGSLLYRRALSLVEEAGLLERAAKTLSAGWEAELTVAVEILFPSWLLFECLAKFGEESPNTRVEVLESVISGTSEALLQHRADIAISPTLPPGFLGAPLISMPIIAVAHPDHPLHHLGRPVTARDLKRHRHLVVRDSGSLRTTRVLSVEVEQRWTVSHMSSSIQAAAGGYGFAWLPEYRIQAELAAGTLAPLPMKEGGRREIQLFLVLADPDFAGPGARRLAEILLSSVHRECSKVAAAQSA
ncbi:MAG TPA: LysR family transcriptional regulator [Magnetospirillaceae bacterium]|nr:LysR family transcriptional regulator [Magnetospirillaceae bacterium]